jgi:hypothetical protein
MELSLDHRQPVTPAASRDPSPGQAALPVIERTDPRVKPAVRRYSFWAECECPDDCLRDHENE